MSPKYSVVIPTMNRSAKLCRAIDSVLQQQVDSKIEIVVIDNYSEDDTQQVLADPRYAEVRVIRQPYRVPRIQNFMTAFQAATGDYVSILYDDEEMLADNLRCKGKILDEHPDVVGVTSSVTKRDAEGNLSPGMLMRPGFTIENRAEYLRNAYQITTGGLPPFLMRQWAVERLKLEERDEPLDDNAYILRLSALGSIATIPDGLVTDTASDAEMVRNGLLELFDLPHSPGVRISLPGFWFYWCQLRFRLEHLIKSPDLSQRQLRSLRRSADDVFRQGIWKAVYFRWVIVKNPGLALRLLSRAVAFTPLVLIPPVGFFLQWKFGNKSAPMPMTPGSEQATTLTPTSNQATSR
jgi:glycosyltransferase involved in cell wall biosynthesis